MLATQLPRLQENKYCTKYAHFCICVYKQICSWRDQVVNSFCVEVELLAFTAVYCCANFESWAWTHRACASVSFYVCNCCEQGIQTVHTLLYAREPAGKEHTCECMIRGVLFSCKSYEWYLKVLGGCDVRRIGGWQDSEQYTLLISVYDVKFNIIILSI